MRTDRTQMWESWWLVMLMWYVLRLYRIVDVVLGSFTHLNCVVSSTQRWTRKLPVETSGHANAGDQRIMWLTCPTTKQ